MSLRRIANLSVQRPNLIGNGITRAKCNLYAELSMNMFARRANDETKQLKFDSLEFDRDRGDLLSCVLIEKQPRYFFQV